MNIPNEKEFAKHITEFLEANGENMTKYNPDGSCERLQYDILIYLKEKLGKYEVAHSDIAEMCVFLTYRTILFSNDEVRRWQREQRRNVMRRSDT